MLGDCVGKNYKQNKTHWGKRKAEIEAKIMKVPLFQDFPSDCNVQKATGGPGEPHPPEIPEGLAACSPPGVTSPFSHE